MKNKRAFRTFSLIIMCAIFVAILGFSGTKTVFADTGKSQVTDTMVGDTYLYKKLQKLAGSSGVILYDSTFANFKKLDLHGTTASQITDISGLKLFTLEKVETLDISGNSITTIPNEVLTWLSGLQTLIVSQNQLTELDLTGCFNLRVVDASGNNLTSFNGYDMLSNGCDIDLSKNKFSSMSEITLPEYVAGATGSVKLYNNNIEDYEVVDGYNVELGLQGLSFNETAVIERSQKVRYYKTASPFRVKTVITKVESEEEIVVIKDWLQAQDLEITLNVGKYRTDYYFVDIDDTEYEISTKRHPKVTTKDEYYNKVKDFMNYFNGQSAEFTVVPTTPQFKYLIKGLYYDENQITQLKSKAQIVLTADEDGECYYRFGENGDWQKGNVINITKGGSYFVEVKSVVGDYESEIRTILINGSASLTLPSIVLILLIVISGLLMFGIVYPLLKKYVL